jgi:CBS domain-containing protein
MTTLVRQMLAGKSAVHTVSPDDTVLDALRVMAEHNIGAVLVTANGALVGILSERDYARKMVLHGKASHDTVVGDVMTAAVVSVTPKWTCDECMAIMTERHVRHLPVMDEDRLVGIISIGDVVSAVVQEQQSTISTLENFIMSGG